MKIEWYELETMVARNNILRKIDEEKSNKT